LPSLVPRQVESNNAYRGRSIGITPIVIAIIVNPRPARDKSKGPRVAPGPLFRRGVRPPSTQNVDYLLPPNLRRGSGFQPVLAWTARTLGTPRLWIALSGMGKSAKGSSLLVGKTL
jgi:hypothetical protein